MRLPKKTEEKKDLVNCVASQLTTPIAKTKFCYLAKPFYYPGSPIARYSLTCLFDPKNKSEGDFLKQLEKIATEQGIETIGYLDGGLISIKFQTKDKIPLFSLSEGKKKPKEIILEHDLPEGFSAVVTFDVNTYFNKKTGKKGFNFCPKKIIFHVDDEEPTVNEGTNDGDNKDSGNRSKPTGNRVRSPKLPSGKKRGVAVKLRSGKNAGKV